MQRIEIQIQPRATDVKPAAVRKSGRVPGIVYGAGGADVAVSVELRQFERSGLARSGSHIVRFASADTALNGDMAIIREVQVNPLSGHAIHVDFLRIDVNKPVDAFVPLHYVGKPVGVVEGGILQPLRRELEVRALPDRLPDKIEVDVSALDIGDSIHVGELQLSEGVEAIDVHENFTLVTVVPPVVEEAPAPVEGVVPAEGEAAAAAGAEGGAAPAKEGEKGEKAKESKGKEKE